MSADSIALKLGRAAGRAAPLILAVLFFVALVIIEDVLGFWAAWAFAFFCLWGSARLARSFKA